MAPRGLMAPRVGEVDGRRILFTNPEAVLWPESGVSKEELLTYYLDMADHLLPFLVDRPLSFLRSEGAQGEHVYQRTAPPGLPSWVPTRRLRTDHAALGYSEYVVGSDRAALAYLVNMGFVSFHPWASTVQAADRPDMMVFDVDPTEIAFREVRNAALLVRSLLGAFKIRSWVKTSGGRGVHVLVPLEPVYTYDQVFTAASAITRLARHREPSLFTFDMRRARRRGKILIDVLRNRRGATLVSPYSVREYPGATVSTPLDWSELEGRAYPEDFHLRNVRERLAERGDLVADFFHHRQSLAPLLSSGRLRRAHARQG
jgi:bifunctional non-homologous end joining protein LigD